MTGVPVGPIVGEAAPVGPRIGCPSGPITGVAAPGVIANPFSSTVVTPPVVRGKPLASTGVAELPPGKPFAPTSG